MCGRFAFFSAHEAMPALFGLAADMPGVIANYNIAPTDLAAVIRKSVDGASNELCLLRWGLVPFWAKDIGIGNRLINARAETVQEKPAFRAAYKRRRCLVPADGYYEWHRTESGKQPYFVTSTDDQPFAMAGLWESWTNKDSGDNVETFTLLTREPNATLARLHHRMPVIVSPSDAEAWLAGSMSAIGAAAPVLPTEDAFGFRAVSKRVNNPRNKDDAVLEPPADPGDDTLNQD